MNDKSSTRHPRLKVLYDFQYETREGQKVTIIKDEELSLINRTNADWWHTTRSTEKEAFYVPATYVVQLSKSPENLEKMSKNRGRKWSANSDERNDLREKEENEMEAKASELESDTLGSPGDQSGGKEKRSHDSFRNVIRKFSSNLNPSSTKQVKSTKLSKKNSINSHDDVKPPKARSDSSAETWAFSKCFGRDMKNAADRQTPFQEELEHALVNRSHRNIIYSSKQDNKMDEKKVKMEKSVFYEATAEIDKTTLMKLENLSAKVKSLSREEEGGSHSRIENVAEKQQQNVEAKARDEKDEAKNARLEDAVKQSETSIIAAKKRQSYINKEQAEESTKNSNSKADVPAQLDDKEKCKNVNESNAKVECSRKVVKKSSVEGEKVMKAKRETKVLPDQGDDSILKDERKMWAIDRLMSELLHKSDKPLPSPESYDSKEKGVNKLVQELYNMSTVHDTKEKTNTKPPKVCNAEKAENVFDFSKSPCAVLPKTVAKKSPKVLDEYNEANILNDNEFMKSKFAEKENARSYEKPSYCSISLNSKRDRVCKNLNIEPRDFREELQLTPSLEKLASEIQFLPANRIPCTADDESMGKVCSKSDSALNQGAKTDQEASTLKFGSLNKNQAVFVTKAPVSSRRVHPEASTSNQHIIRKHSFAKSNTKILDKLKRKTRSLDDLNLPDDSGLYLAKSLPLEENAEKKKPVPDLRSKDSFKKAVALFTGKDQATAPVKPISAKRRIIGALAKLEIKDRKEAPKVLVRSEGKVKRNCYNFETIDIEKSTAVGFTTLLRTSDSGSEEFLQNKTFPSVDSKKSSVENLSRSMSNDDDLSSGKENSFLNGTSRSLSDELILSSNASSLDQLESGGHSTFDTSANSSSFCEKEEDGSPENLVKLPLGWKQHYDQKTKQICFLNSRGDKWFSSNDSEGKIYFFEENSNESSWALPQVDNDKAPRSRSFSRQIMPNEDYLYTRISEEEDEAAKGLQQPANWPQLFHGNMCILKEGVLDRTKITENGRKLKKNWNVSYAVLTELFLLFFKDAKTFSAMKMGQLTTAKPDISVDLNGASIGPGERFTSRKNVYIIGTILGLQVLIQSDNAVYAAEWYREIYDAVRRLPSGQTHGNVMTMEE